MPTIVTLTGPITGPNSAQMTVPFILTLDSAAGSGGVNVTVSSTGSGDSFQLTQGGGNLTGNVVTIAQGATTQTFYITSGSTAGARTISMTNGSGLTNAGIPFMYTTAAVATSITLTCVANPTSMLTAPLGYAIAYKLTLNGIPPSTGLTITPSSTRGSDTLSLTVGGGAVTTLSIPYGSAETLTFCMTLGGSTGSRTLTFTSSSLTTSGSFTVKCPVRSARPGRPTVRRVGTE